MMEHFKVRAPGVVKLLGEHAVVYGKLSVAVALGMYSLAEASDGPAGKIVIEVPDWGGARLEADARELGEAYDDYRSMELGAFGEKHGWPRPGSMLPFAVIAGRMAADHGASTAGVHIVMHSDIPPGKGCASSAATSAAFTVALARWCKASPSDGDMIDIIRDGERLFHMNRNAGAIDASTTYYGGCVSYEAERQARREEIGSGIGMVLIDTGPKAPTSETVGRVAEIYRTRRDYAQGLLDRIDVCSRKGLDALKAGDLALLGAYMNEDHELLRQLGVSSRRLDEAVYAARRMGALGAKLSGGGGGGIAIAISETAERLASQLRASGFNTYTADISMTGAGESNSK